MNNELKTFIQKRMPHQMSRFPELLTTIELIGNIPLATSLTEKQVEQLIAVCDSNREVMNIAEKFIDYEN